MRAFAAAVDDPDARRTVDAMLLAMQRRGGGATATCEPFAGAALGWSSPIGTDVCEDPVRHGPTGCVLVGDIRLDNGPELASRLDLGGPTDPEVALITWVRWGAAGLRRLTGAFAFVVADPRHRSLIAVRDQLGVKPMLWRIDAGGAAFGSSLPGLLAARTARPSVDLHRVRQFQFAELEAATLTSTEFIGMRRLGPATVLHFLDSRVTTKRWWNLERPDVWRDADDGEYEEALDEVLQRAVRSRLDAHTPTGVMLSGGIDSSVLAAVASRVGDIRTLSAIDPDGGAESCAIRAVIEHLDPDHAFLTPDDVTASNWLDNLLGAPDGLFDTAGSLLPLVSGLAEQFGHRVALTGLAGDNVLAVGRARHMDHLIRQGRLIRAARDGARAGPAAQIDPRRFGTALARALVPGSVRVGRRRRQLRKRSHALVDSSMLLIDAATRSRLVDEMTAVRAQATTDPIVDAVTHPFVTAALERYDRIGARASVELRHPWLDLRVIRFVLSLPSEQLHHEGWSKWVVRRLAQRLLPFGIARRPKQADLGWRFWAETPEPAPSPGPPGFWIPGARPRDDEARWNRLISDSWWDRQARP